MRFVLAVALAAGCGRIDIDPVTTTHGYLIDERSPQIVLFDVGDDGALSERGAFAFDAQPTRMVADASGTHLFVTTSPGSVRSFGIERFTGRLDPISVQPTADVFAIATNDQTVYAGASVPESIWGFAIASDGSLAPIAGSPWSHAGIDSISVAVDPTGRWLYAGCSFDNTVYGFAITPGTGALTVIPEIAWKPNVSTPWGLFIDKTARFGFVAPDSSGPVPGFTIDSTSGLLATTPGSPFGSDGGLTIYSSFDRERGRLFMANQAQGSFTLTGYTIDSTAGSLAHVAGSPVDTSPRTAISVALSPRTNDVYVTNEHEELLQLRSDATGMTNVRTDAIPGIVAAGQFLIVETR